MYMGEMGKSLGENIKLESLSMKLTKAKTQSQMEFWRNIKPNRNIRKLNFEQCKINDKVVGFIAEFIAEEGISL